MTNLRWTVFRVRGDRRPPVIDGLQFVACIGALRSALGETRWHFRWTAGATEETVDGLRVEVPYDSPQRDGLFEQLESRVPPPDELVAEPLRADVDLDPVQSPQEMDHCLTLLWRYSECLVDLRMRNPGLGARQYEGLTPGAFLALVTGDRRHLERAMEDAGATSIPTVALGRLAGLVRAAPIPYRVPPRNHAEAVSAARIHHLMACTFSHEYYPYTNA